jgi:C-terminal processing protease CtpA/Prc
VSLGQAIEYYNDYNIRIRYIYPGSPFEQYGVTRGWTLTHLDSVPVMEYVASGKFERAFYKENQLYTFKDLKGESHSFRSSPLSTLSVRSSLKADVIEPGDYPGLTEPVGYFLYMSYKAGFLDDIDNAFALFKEAGVKKVILDLRYNGGGDGRASDLLVSYLAPEPADNMVYKRTIHNRELSIYNSNDTIHRKPNSLDLDALYVIGGSGTASASEVTINGLKPYLDLYLVGDTTYGKPNGMYVLLYPGEDEDYARYDVGDYSNLKLVYLPIAFFSKNSLDESIPYKGFIPDNYRPDDIKHDFGVEEDNIKACLEHMVNGSFPALPGLFSTQMKGSVSERQLQIPDDNIISPLYGSTLLPLPKELR